MTDARLLGGRYEVGPPLGYGGMAEVHRGQDLRLGRTVAIKVLRTDLARDSGFQARFRREAQNAAALNHPAIVAVYDTGEDQTGREPVPYIIMEYVEGRTLKEVQTAEGPLMPRRAMEIVADVCAALDFSHRHGIIHRDIKPANVMLTNAGAVKVMDFGIARAIASATSAMTQTSAVIGTAQYLSPEQARGETVDARSDVYSTGCLLYELLVGQPPFTGDNPVSVAYQHVREDPIPPGERNPDVTPSMDAIVLKAMAKNPANRYQSAGEMRADLLRAAAGQRVAATPVMPSEERTAIIGSPVSGGPQRGYQGYPTPPVEEPPKRKGATYALVALAVITVFALTAFAVSYLLRSNEADLTMPDVVGKSQEVALQELRDRGLDPTPRPVASKEEDKGKVVRQNPDEGEKVKRNDKVTIDVGRGPETSTVPKVVNLPLAGAKEKITAAGLKVAPKTETIDSAKPKDTVLKVSPAEGETVSKGSIVTLTVSNGKLKLVPDLTGKSRVAATNLLAEAGLRAVFVEVPTNSTTPNTVISQSPKQNTEVQPGSTVTVQVAVPPEPSTNPTTPDGEESETPSPPPSTSSSPSTGSPSPQNLLPRIGGG